METGNQYRPLSEKEIAELALNGCTADDWTLIGVKGEFDPSRCRNARFSGRVMLGEFGRDQVDGSGVRLMSGIYSSHLHNCVVGDNCAVYNVGDYIANYILDDGVVIKDCGRIHTEGISSFGNGIPVAVMSETGARAVKIWDRLSAHQAYIFALYRHRTAAVNMMEKMTDDYVKGITSDMGRIGSGTRIAGCSHIRNVKFGQGSVIEGALRLNEGSVNSCGADPVFIGPGVIMEHFIVCSGSTVTDSTIIDKCFIGQGCVLGKHYSAENSLFFANCGGFHGEACSVFAGPYTVTHHKSTLLIAGIFSFMNAGSGSNQSNHMYKLGPIHQGILERGSKTTSDSYLLWPARIGPFTLVMGRHYKNMDTSLFPFSYLIESNDESILVPGINLRSVGTIRDAQKWPQRDRRKDPLKTDRINFNLLSPYTIRKMISGRDLLLRIRKDQEGTGDAYSYDGMKILPHALERGIILYQMGIDKFLGNSIIKRLEARRFRSDDEIRARLKPESSHGKGEWIDLAGLIVPKDDVEALLDDIENGRISSLEAISGEFQKMHDSYYEWEWTWAAGRLEEASGKKIGELTAREIIEVVKRWKKSVLELDNLLYEDARKEFTLSSMTGYGIDGGDEEKHLDFEQVRGVFESNPVVTAIRDHIVKKSDLGDELISRLISVE